MRIYLDSLRDSGDKVRIGKAQCSLALCADRSGNCEMACEYLQAFLDEGNGDPKESAWACSQLGITHNRLGNFDKAVGYFEQQFQLLAAIPVDLDNKLLIVAKTRFENANNTAAVQLGISRANAQMERVFDLIVDKDLNGILAWKASGSSINAGKSR